MSYRRLALVCVLLTIANVAPPAASDELAVADVVSNVNRANLALDTWRAEFLERRVFVHFDYTEERHGTMLFARDIGLRLDIIDPDRSTVVIHDSVAEQWKPKTRQLHVYRFGEDRSTGGHLPIPIAIGQDGWDPAADASLRIVEHNDDSVILEITPDDGSVYQSKTIWFDAKSWLPQRVRLVEQTDDVVTYSFSQIHSNEAVSPAAFELDLPADAEIVEHEDLPSF